MENKVYLLEVENLFSDERQPIKVFKAEYKALLEGEKIVSVLNYKQSQEYTYRVYQLEIDND
jgi:hypothetical protein